VCCCVVVVVVCCCVVVVVACCLLFVVVFVGLLFVCLFAVLLFVVCCLLHILHVLIAFTNAAVVCVAKGEKSTFEHTIGSFEQTRLGWESQIGESESVHGAPENCAEGTSPCVRMIVVFAFVVRSNKNHSYQDTKRRLEALQKKYYQQKRAGKVWNPNMAPETPVQNNVADKV
jgi:hypothetical protein